MLPAWVFELEGVPYQDKGRTVDGADCWGIAYLALARMGWIIPTYTEEYATADERAVIADLIDEKRSSWQEIPLGDEQVGDVLLLRTVLERGTHVGVIVGRGMMLHMRNGKRSGVETYRSGFWADRVLGIFRYVI